MRDKIIDYLKENVSLIGDLVQDVNSWDSGLDDYMWFTHDEYFYEDFFVKKDEVARAIYYSSNYNYCDDYVRFNAYGNLETCCEYERDATLRDNVEEIFDEWLEEYQNGNLCDSYDEEFMEMVNALGGVENE